MNLPWPSSNFSWPTWFRLVGSAVSRPNTRWGSLGQRAVRRTARVAFQRPSSLAEGRDPETHLVMTRHTVHSKERWLARARRPGCQFGADWWPGWLQIQSSRSVVGSATLVWGEGRGQDSAAGRLPLQARGVGRSAQGPARGPRPTPSSSPEAPERTPTIQDRWSVHRIAHHHRRLCKEQSVEW